MLSVNAHTIRGVHHRDLIHRAVFALDLNHRRVIDVNLPIDDARRIHRGGDVAGRRNDDARDLGDVLLVKVQVDDLSGLGLRISLIREIDEGRAQLHAGGIIRTVIDRNREIIGAGCAPGGQRCENLGRRICSKLELDVLLWHGCHSPVAEHDAQRFGCAGSGKIPGSDHNAAAHLLHDSAHVALDAGAAPAVQHDPAGIQNAKAPDVDARRNEHGLIVVNPHAHIAARDLLRLIRSVGIQNTRNGAVGRVKPRAALRINEQIERVILRDRLARHDGLPLLCLRTDGDLILREVDVNIDLLFVIACIICL